MGQAMPLVRDELPDAFALLPGREKVSPWARGLLDALADASIEQVVITKGAVNRICEHVVQAAGAALAGGGAGDAAGS